MNYNEMTDLEINKAVSKYFKSQIFLNIFGEPVRLEPNPAATYTGNDFDEVPFDPCNSWADAGPIIQEYGIELGYDGITWQASASLRGIEPYDDWKSYPESPCRLTMIVFLMIMERK